MTTYRRGDIVLVPFPFSDLSQAKRRPALVISTDAFNKAAREIVIAQITSRTRARALPGDYLVSRWKEAGLIAPSLVRARVTTLQNTLPARTLGRMPDDEMSAVSRSLAGALGL